MEGMGLLVHGLPEEASAWGYAHQAVPAVPTGIPGTLLA
jgi:hypothetical protein